MEKSWNGIARCPERFRIRAFMRCTRTVGVLVPSLHRESTDSQIVIPWASRVYGFVGSYIYSLGCGSGPKAHTPPEGHGMTYL